MLHHSNTTFFYQNSVLVLNVVQTEILDFKKEVSVFLFEPTVWLRY